MSWIEEEEMNRRVQQYAKFRKHKLGNSKDSHGVHQFALLSSSRCICLEERA